MRDSVLFYRSFVDAIDMLPDDEQLKAYRAIARYGLDGTEQMTALDGAAGAVFLLAKPRIDKSNELRDRNTTAYKEWRDAVLKRDGYQCAKCGSKDKLHAHHIKPYHEYPDLRLDFNNGITLCAACHREVHHEG